MSEDTSIPKLTITRNSHGLISGANYKYTPEGLIDWRAMINPKHLTINKQNFKDGPIPEDISTVSDKDLLILLQGIKELGWMRGYSSVTYQVTAPSDNCTIAVCCIQWLPNFETENRTIFSSGIGDATSQSATGFGKMFLAPIAENRAFVRCV